MVAARLWATIGVLGFGGPAGQIALMHRLVVEERRWIDEPRFLHALNYCVLLPGPEAQQLAIYLGWLLHGVRGGTVAGVLFVLPGAAIILALSIVYVSFAQLAVVGALLYGLKAAVVAVVIAALLRIGKRALHGPVAWGLAVVAFVALRLFDLPFPVVVIGAGAIGAAAAAAGLWSPVSGHGGPGGEQARLARVVGNTRHANIAAAAFLALWLVPLGLLVSALGSDHVLAQLGVFLSKMAVVTFGGAYAVLAYVAQEAVSGYGWLGPGQMLDGLGLAETTPGPLILVLQFVGFLAAFQDPGARDPLLLGVLGAAVATWVTFVPSFLWIFLGAPYVERLRRNRWLAGAFAGITAAVAGVLLNLVAWFAAHVIFAEVGVWQRGPLVLLAPEWASIDVVALVLAVAAFVALHRLRLGVVPTLAAATALGALVRLFIA
ncbi:MAG: chromate efflux transporter [Alphaproteobacteria bacterium]|nr:chromate efflux transporter [Alphaproteobacteria bacterium]